MDNKRDLGALKEYLWEQFDQAITQKYEDPMVSGENSPSNFTIHHRQSLAQLAQAIVAVEAEQRQQAEAAARKKARTSGFSGTTPDLNV